MKNTNAQIQKNTKRKLTIVISTLVAGLFAATSNSSVVQAAELEKIEPIKQISLYQEAKESLALSFNGLTINQNYNDEAVKSTMAKQQNSTIKNIPITLTKANLVSE